jgi:hypothetical protein
LYLSPPAFLESPQDRIEERQRQKKLHDEFRKKKEDKFEEYQDLFAKDFPKGMAAHYNFLTESIITDLERAIQNINPPTSNVMTQHYRIMKERLHIYQYLRQQQTSQHLSHTPPLTQPISKPGTYCIPTTRP